MWGWLDGIIGTLGTIAQKIGDLPSVIALNIRNAFDSLFENVKNIWDGIKELPTKILDGIKDIFVPDAEEIDAKFNAFLDTLKMKLSFDTDFFTNLVSGEQPVTDQYMDYNLSGVGDFKLKVFDTKFLYDGVTYFRPFIRGFLVLLMGFYNVKMVLSFIRQDAGVVTGKAVSASVKKE